MGQYLTAIDRYRYHEIPAIHRAYATVLLQLRMPSLKPGFQRTQRKVQSWARTRNETCSNLTQTQEVANSIAGIYHVMQDNGGGVLDELRHLDNFRVYCTNAAD